MAGIPRQINKEVRRAIVALKTPWELVKKRDHYILRINGRQIVVGGNSSTDKGYLVKRTLEEIKRSRQRSEK